MLVSEALAEGAVIVSQDDRLHSYQVPIVW
jgi:PIN domain nuclease of toxin-antitoxin system